MSKAIAVILAGGRSKRMGILCHPRPKPLLPFGGKYNVIDFTLSNCFCSQLRDVLLITAHQESQIADYIEKWRISNPDCLDISVIRACNGGYSGTADAVGKNLNHIRQHNPELVILLAADHVYNYESSDIPVLGKDCIIPPYTAVSCSARVPAYSLFGSRDSAQLPLKLGEQSNKVAVSSLLSLLEYI